MNKIVINGYVVPFLSDPVVLPYVFHKGQFEIAGAECEKLFEYLVETKAKHELTIEIYINGDRHFFIGTIVGAEPIKFTILNRRIISIIRKQYITD